MRTYPHREFPTIRWKTPVSILGTSCISSLQLLSLPKAIPQILIFFLPKLIPQIFIFFLEAFNLILKLKRLAINITSDTHRTPPGRAHKSPVARSLDGGQNIILESPRQSA